MTDIYNITNVTQANNLWEFTREINTMTGDLFGVLFLFVIFLIVFITFSKMDVKRTFVISSFVTSFVGILFWSIKFIPFHILLVPISMLVVSIFVLLLTD